MKAMLTAVAVALAAGALAPAAHAEGPRVSSENNWPGMTDPNGVTGYTYPVYRTRPQTVGAPHYVWQEGYENGGKWVMIKGQSHDSTNAAYPFEVNGQMFIPSSSVRLTAEPRKFAVFVYNAAPDELTWDVMPQAKVVSQLKSAAGSKLVFQLDGAPSAPLSVTVKKNGDERRITVPIVVQ